MNYSNLGYDESTSVTCKLYHDNYFLIPTECSSEANILVNITGLTVQDGSVHYDAADNSR